MSIISSTQFGRTRGATVLFSFIASLIFLLVCGMSHVSGDSSVSSNFFAVAAATRQKRKVREPSESLPSFSSDDTAKDAAAAADDDKRRDPPSRSRSLSPSLTPSASILARKKAFANNSKTNIPILTDSQLEILADQVFDGIVQEIHYHDHHPHKNSDDANQRRWIDRYFRITVLVTTVIHIRDKPLITLSHSQHDLKKLKEENVKHGGIAEHQHEVKVGDLVDVMLWEAYQRPDYGPAGAMMKGLEVGYVLIPKRPDPEVEYRFFTQGMAHRMRLYRTAYPTAGKDLPAFEALIPNGVQVVKDDGTGDDTPMQQRKLRTKSLKFDEL